MTNDRHGWMRSVMQVLYHNLIRNPVIAVRYFVWKLIQLLKGLGLGLVSLLLSEKDKRTLLIASLYRVVENDNTDWSVASERLNRKLRLVEKIDALVFPAMMADNLWVKEDVIKCVTECDIAHARTYSEQIARMAPRFLLYGPLDKLVKDIESVIYLRKAEQTA